MRFVEQLKACQDCRRASTSAKYGKEQSKHQNQTKQPTKNAGAVGTGTSLEKSSAQLLEIPAASATNETTFLQNVEASRLERV